MNTLRDHQSAGDRAKTPVRLAVKGQLYEREDSANYSYPKTDDKQWLECIPSEIRKDITSLRLNENGVECFSLWFNAGKIYYAYRRLLYGRGGSDCAMVVICSDRPVSDGSVLVTVMRDVVDYCMRLTSSLNIDDAIIKEKLSVLSFLPVSIQGTDQGARSAVAAGQPVPATRKNAYRTYSNEDELVFILENPCQSSYNRFERIMLVQKDLVSQPGIEEVGGKVNPNYIIINSPDSSLKEGKTIVEAGENFCISYRKTGYNDYTTQEQRVGSPSPYFTVKKNQIIITPASEAKVNFKKDIRVNLKDKHGNPIANWDCLVKYSNGEMKSCKSLKNPGYISLSDGLFECRFSARGFKPQNESVDTRKKDSISLSLNSLGNEVNFHLFPAWRNPFAKKPSGLIPVEASLSGSDPFYDKYRESLDGSRPYPCFYVSKSNPFIILLLMSLLMLAVGIFIGSKFSPSSSAVNTEDTTGTSGGDLSEKEKEEEDIKILNANPVWKVNEMKSKKYKDFLESLMDNPEKAEEHKEITNKQWEDFKKNKKERAAHVKKCKGRKSIDWNEINMTETEKEKKDSSYLVENTIWEVSKLRSKRYMELMSDLKTAPIQAVKNDQYPQLNQNVQWKYFVDHRRDPDIPYSTQIPKMLENGKLDWNQFPITQGNASQTPGTPPANPSKVFEVR